LWSASFLQREIKKGGRNNNMADTTRFVPEHRRQTYKGKNLFKGEEVRRRREEQQVEIRKQKRDENLAKRRNLAFMFPDTSMESDTDEDISGVDDKVSILYPWI
jgi:importin subunit alpha-6/7